MLKSAIGRPQHSAFGDDAYKTLPSKAAALTHSLILNHPFHDANKRTGILSGCIFMMLNGCDLVAARSSLLTVALEVAEKVRGFEGLEEWFGDETNMLPLKEEEWTELKREELEERFARGDEQGPAV